jgi:PAS domain S-box-containing protein
MEKARILIVEDEAIIAMEIESQLQNLGYEITSIVDTGEKAIKKAEEDKPDLILMDIRIKGEMDGIETAEIILNKFGIPVIFSTAYADEERLNRAKLTQPFGYLLKPIQERELKVTIEMAVYVAKVDTGRKKAESELRKTKDQLEIQVLKRTNELKKNQERLELALDGAELGLWDWNIQTGEVQFSDSWAKILGYLVDEIKPHVSTWEKLLHPEDKEKVMLCLNSNLEGRSLFYETEYRLRSKSGEWKWFLARGKVVERSKAGQSLRHAGTHLDITDRVKILSDLQKAKKEAENANKIKSEFLSNISHEIRTPMHQILSYSKFGIDKIDKVEKEKLSHYFLKIRTIGNSLLSLMNNLLDLSKLESGKMDYDMKIIHPQSIINNTIGEFHSLIDEKEIILEKNIESSISSINCDEIKIGQVVRNLLSNAIKFTPNGNKVLIVVKSKELPINDKIIVPSVLFTVFDQGIGIPEDELETIFDKFVQSSKTKTGAGGTGLGLAICKEIIEAHNGKIWAENNPEGGSTFSFMLPYDQKLNKD